MSADFGGLGSGVPVRRHRRSLQQRFSFLWNMSSDAGGDGQRGDGTIGVGDHWIKLLGRLLSFNPIDRPSAAACLAVPLLDGARARWAQTYEGIGEEAIGGEASSTDAGSDAVAMHADGSSFESYYETGSNNFNTYRSAVLDELQKHYWNDADEEWLHSQWTF